MERNRCAKQCNWLASQICLAGMPRQRCCTIGYLQKVWRGVSEAISVISQMSALHAARLTTSAERCCTHAVVHVSRGFHVVRPMSFQMHYRDCPGGYNDNIYVNWFAHLVARRRCPEGGDRQSWWYNAHRHEMDLSMAVVTETLESEPLSLHRES